MAHEAIGDKNDEDPGLRRRSPLMETYQTRKRRFDRVFNRWFVVRINLVLLGVVFLLMCLEDIVPDRGYSTNRDPGTRMFEAVLSILPDLLYALGLSHAQIRVLLVVLGVLSFASAIAIGIWLSHTDPRQTRPHPPRRGGP